MSLRGARRDQQIDEVATGNPSDRSESRLSSASKSGDQEQSKQDEGDKGNQPTDGKDEEQQLDQLEAVAVGFWHPSLKDVRLEAMRKWTITTTFLMVFIIGALSIYWGALFRVEDNLHHLNVYVVDFDTRAAPYNTSGLEPVVGPAITQLASKLVASSEPTLGYEVMPPSAFDYDPIQVRRYVYDWHAWAAIIINSNATAMLRSALQNGNTSYDPLGACQLIYIDSRDDTNWYDFMAPQLTAFMTEATSIVGAAWTGTVLEDAGNNVTLLANAASVPQALSPAIGFSQFNLRPLYPYQTIPAVSIGLIYLIIVSFFSFSFYLPIHFKYLKPEGHPPLKFHQLILWRWLATVAAYFMLSLAYSLISLAFQINFSGGNPVTSPTEVTSTTDGYSNPDAYGHGTFLVYWMLNFFGMIALGLACENVAMFVGQPWMGMWLIFWVITNVSTAFYDIDIEPTFYRYGYAWPLHYIVEGSRQILFGLHSRLGLDFGVLIAWGVVNTTLFPFACYFMRWKSKKGVNEYYT